MTPVGQELAALVAARLGLDVRRLHATALRRALAAVESDLGVAGDADLVRLLRVRPSDDEAWRRLAARLTIPETSFFRHPALFAALERRALMPLIADRRSRGDRRLSLWCAGCATGEEPYTLAMLLDRWIPNAAEWRIDLFGTDISEDAIACAMVGRYPERAMATVPEPFQRRWFDQADDGQLEVSAELRRRVRFAVHNLVGDEPPHGSAGHPGFDLILCRNTLMYLTEAQQRAALGRLSGALAIDGWLALGPAELPIGRIAGFAAAPESEALLLRRGSEPTVLDTRAPARLESRSWTAADSPSCETDRPLAAPSPVFAEAPPRVSAPLHLRADQPLVDDAATLRSRAIACEERGDLAAAETARRGVLYLGHDSIADRFLLGALLRRRGKQRAARRCLTGVLAAVEDTPPDTVVAPELGLTAARIGAAVRRLLAHEDGEQERRDG